MLNVVSLIQEKVCQAVQELYGAEFQAANVPVNTTRKEFEGDYTVVVFPFTKVARQKPEVIAQQLGQYLTEQLPELVDFNVVKGFLNLTVGDEYWKSFLLGPAQDTRYGKQPASGKKVVIESCSPNTNKPLHLGHIRNILLGWSMSQILEAVGHEVVKVQIINDRGIAICKSMLAWQKYGNGNTPASVTMKPDHFVGYYYVKFEQEFQAEYKEWQESTEGRQVFEAQHKENESPTEFFKRYKDTYFNEYSQLGQEARSLLLAWEAGEEEVVALWKKMNGWVYAGFDVTFEKLGVTFDQIYYESETYLLGKKMVEKGLEQGVFYRCEDGSV
ncbi:MAG: arginine--tRNA ligase, partial [Bacteroidetes bacterium]